MVGGPVSWGRSWVWAVGAWGMSRVPPLTEGQLYCLSTPREPGASHCGILSLGQAGGGGEAGAGHGIVPSGPTSVPQAQPSRDVPLSSGYPLGLSDLCCLPRAVRASASPRLWSPCQLGAGGPGRVDSCTPKSLTPLGSRDHPPLGRGVGPACALSEAGSHPWALPAACQWLPCPHGGGSGHCQASLQAQGKRCCGWPGSRTQGPSPLPAPPGPKA